MKTQPTDWKKISADHISDKGPGPRIHKELFQFNNKETNESIKQWAKDPNKHFLCKIYKWPRSTGKDIYWSPGKYKIKTAMRHHFILTRMAITEKTVKVLVRKWSSWAHETPLVGLNDGAAAVEDKFGSSSKC